MYKAVTGVSSVFPGGVKEYSTPRGASVRTRDKTATLKLAQTLGKTPIAVWE